MVIGYIRISKGGLSKAKQIALLRESGITDFSDEGQVFVDTPRLKTHSAVPEDLEYRELLLRKLKTGDTVLVADYAILGLSAEDWLYAVGEITAKGTSLKICQTDETFKWPKGAIEIATELAQGAAKARRTLAHNQTRKAREARPKSKTRRGPPRVDEKIVEAARKDWFDPDGPSGAAIAKLHGIGKNTLYRRFGPITDCREKYEGQ